CHATAASPWSTPEEAKGRNCSPRSRLPTAVAGCWRAGTSPSPAGTADAAPGAQRGRHAGEIPSWISPAATGEKPLPSRPTTARLLGEYVVPHRMRDPSGDHDGEVSEG